MKQTIQYNEWTKKIKIKINWDILALDHIEKKLKIQKNKNTKSIYKLNY